MWQQEFLRNFLLQKPRQHEEWMVPLDFAMDSNSCRHLMFKRITETAQFKAVASAQDPFLLQFSKSPTPGKVVSGTRRQNFSTGPISSKKLTRCCYLKRQDLVGKQWMPLHVKLPSGFRPERYISSCRLDGWISSACYERGHREDQR